MVSKAGKVKHKRLSNPSIVVDMEVAGCLPGPLLESQRKADLVQNHTD